MKKYMAISATTDKCGDSFGGTSEFTKEALSQLAKTAPQKPIFIDNGVKKIGEVLSAKNDNGSLILELYLDDDIAIYKLDRIVPNFVVKEDDWSESVDDVVWCVDVGDDVHRIIKSAESVSYVITKTPVEQKLPEITPIT